MPGVKCSTSQQKQLLFDVIRTALEEGWSEVWSDSRGKQGLSETPRQHGLVRELSLQLQRLTDLGSKSWTCTNERIDRLEWNDEHRENLIGNRDGLRALAGKSGVPDEFALFNTGEIKPAAVNLKRKSRPTRSDHTHVVRNDTSGENGFAHAIALKS